MQARVCIGSCFLGHQLADLQLLSRVMASLKDSFEKYTVACNFCGPGKIFVVKHALDHALDHEYFTHK